MANIQTASEQMVSELQAWRLLFGDWKVREAKKWVNSIHTAPGAEWRPAEQKEMAAFLGVRENSYSRWENGWPVSLPTTVRRALLQIATDELGLDISAKKYMKGDEAKRLKLLSSTIKQAQKLRSESGG